MIIIISFYVFQGQDVFYLVPLDKADYYVKAFLGSAFALKVIEVAHIIIEQVCNFPSFTCS